MSGAGRYVTPAARCVAVAWALAVAMALAVAAAPKRQGPPSTGRRPGASPRRRPMGSTTRPADRGRTPFRWRLSEQQKSDVLAFAKAHLPDEYARLQRLSRGDPAHATPAFARLYRLYLNVRRYPADVRDAAIDRHKVYREIYDTVHQLQRAGAPADKAPLLARLRTLLGRQFDREQVIREYEVKRLAQRVTDLATQLKRRKGERDKVIEQRLRKILQGPPKPSTRPTTRPKPRPGRGTFRPLDEKRRREVIAFAHKHMPELVQRLEKLTRTKPQRARVAMRQLHDLIRRIRAMPAAVGDAAIAVHKLNVAVHTAGARARRAAEPAEKDKLTGQMRALLRKQFDHEQVVDEFMVKRLGQQLAFLKTELRRRRRERAEIIAKRAERLAAPRTASGSKPTPKG